MSGGFFVNLSPSKGLGRVIRAGDRHTGVGLRIQRRLLIPLLDAGAIGFAMAATVPQFGPGEVVGAIVLQCLAYRSIGLNRWNSAQRPSTRVVAILLASVGSALLLSLVIACLGGAHLPLGRIALVFFTTGLVSRASMRRVAFLVATPLRADDASEIAYTLKDALMPTYRMSSDPSALQAALLAQKANEKSRGSLAPLPLRETPGDGLSFRVKRLCDLIGAIPLSVLLLPCLAVLSSLMKLIGLGPVFHSQTRVTLNSRCFELYKLRTMNTDAEPSGLPVWPRSTDERITPIGRFLRRFWIDEWPQILNVLRGDLSLVGPRPERPLFVKEFVLYLPKYNGRHEATCGITGLSQALGFAGNTSLRKRLFLDRLYIYKWSPWLDFKILLMTACHFFIRHNRKQFDYTPGTGQKIP